MSSRSSAPVDVECLQCGHPVRRHRMVAVCYALDGGEVCSCVGIATDVRVVGQGQPAPQISGLSGPSEGVRAGGR
jgi:hypothetical protein